MTAIFGRLVNGCWYLFRVVVALAFIAVMAVGGYLFFRLDDETRRLSEAVLARLCDPMTTRVGSARYVSGRGVTMYDVEVLERRPGRSPEALFEIAELRVEGRFDIATLLQGKPQIQRVIAKNPRLFATRRRDGVWNVAGFRPPPTGEGPPPAIELQNATVVLRDEASPALRPLTLEHLYASLSPSDDRQRFVIKASADETLARRVRIEGAVDQDGGRYNLKISTAGLPLTPELMAAVRALAPAPFPLPTIHGVAGFEATVARTAADTPVDWRVGFQIADGGAHSPLLKRPLRSVQIAGAASREELQIERFTASWGDATIRVAGRRRGWGPRSPMAVRLRVDGFDIGATPVAVLPSDARRLWDRFKPAGVVNVAVDAQYNGRAWSPRATIEAHNASFEDADKFAYRLTGGKGTIKLNGGAGESVPPPPGEAGTTAAVDLTALVEGAPVRITASLQNLESMRRPRRAPWRSATAETGRPGMPPGWIEITGNGVPITPRVVAALPGEPVRRFVESLHISGGIDLRWRADRPDAADPLHTSALDLRLVNCRLNYDRFPYPLSGVTGWVRQRGQQWEFRELRSVDARGRTLVTGSGKLTPEGDGLALTMRFDGADAPLDQTLYAALPASAQQAWAFLRPRGLLGFTADVTRSPGAAQPNVRLSMRPQGKVTIEPAFSDNGYRYRLEKLDGRFDWENERLTMRAARAAHGRTSYTADGEWQSLDDGAWRLGLQGLHADRLAFNHDFLTAAPVGLRSVVEAIEPRGVFDLFDSRLELLQRSGPSAVVEARWDLAINCHQATLNTGVPLDGVSGVVRLSGSSDGASASTAGELDLDSLFWNDLQLTDVRGPIWADGADCFLGEGVARKLGGDPRRVQASAYGGEVAINSWVQHGGRPRYGLSVDLKGVDVARLSSEWLERPEALKGTMEGQLKFEGAGTSIYGLTGTGDLAIADADLYELPLLLSMLKYFRNRTPDNTAFNRLEAEFAMQGEEIQFAHLDLLGDAVSLYGRGTATLDRELDLVFHSIVGRNDFVVPVLRSLVGQASEQLLRLRVLGTADAPEIRREALPMVGNMIEQFQTELAPPTTATAPAGAPPPRR